MAKGGVMVLVVGPSGAGKDTLLRHAASRLADDHRFVFPQRLVTRAPDASLEDHAAISRSEFETLRERGDHTLCWEAHGLGYVIPRDVAVAVRAGQIAVCNGSRRILADAVARFPGCRIVVIEADPDVRAARLLARGRETRAEVAARLAREVAAPVEAADAVRIDNSSDLETAIAAFVGVLGDTAVLTARD